MYSSHPLAQFYTAALGGPVLYHCEVIRLHLDGRSLPHASDASFLHRETPTSPYVLQTAVCVLTDPARPRRVSRQRERYASPSKRRKRVDAPAQAYSVVISNSFPDFMRDRVAGIRSLISLSESCSIPVQNLAYIGHVSEQRAKSGLRNSATCLLCQFLVFVTIAVHFNED